MPSRSSRTIGALFALHAGDALGAPLEFEPHDLIRSLHPGGNAAFPRRLTGGGVFSWAPGAATDDTDLTRAVLLAYRDAILSHDHQDTSSVDLVTRAAEHCLAWYEGHWPGRTPDTLPVDVGGATANGLSSYRNSRDPSSSGDGQGSAGNGSLMRCLPTGLFQPDMELLIAESQRISAFTHDDRRCTVACAAYNAIVSSLVLRGSSAPDAVSAGRDVAMSLEGGRPGGPVHAAIELGRRISLADVADRGPSARDFPGSCSGFVLESLTLAVAAVLDERSLEDVLGDVVRVGRDTDTNAAIAGGLLGARDGEEAVPTEWKDMLQFGQEFREIAGTILKAQGVS